MKALLTTGVFLLAPFVAPLMEGVRNGVTMDEPIAGKIVQRGTNILVRWENVPQSFDLENTTNLVTWDYFVRIEFREPKEDRNFEVLLGSAEQREFWRLVGRAAP